MRTAPYRPSRERGILGKSLATRFRSGREGLEVRTRDRAGDRTRLGGGERGKRLRPQFGATDRRQTVCPHLMVEIQVPTVRNWLHPEGYLNAELPSNRHHKDLST